VCVCVCVCVEHEKWEDQGLAGKMTYQIRRETLDTNMRSLGWLTRMVSSGMLRRVALVRTDVSEEPSTSFIRVTRIDELGTRKYQVFLRSVRRLLVAASVVPSSPILVILMKEALGSSETSVLTRPTRRNIPEDTILHSHCRENINLTRMVKIQPT
jgi:hypothetical protein